MERRIEKATLRSGDRIIFAKATDVYDVILITPSADEETLQTCSTLDSARDVARGGVSGGRLWWRRPLSSGRDRAVQDFHNRFDPPNFGIVAMAGAGRTC